MEDKSRIDRPLDSLANLNVYFRHLSRSHTCFHNKPAKQLPSPTLLPGYATDVDKQCQMALGEEYRGCSSQKVSLSDPHNFYGGFLNLNYAMFQ